MADSAPLRVTFIPSFEELRTEWSGLAASAGGIFATYEWVETWWRHNGEGRELLLHACRDETGTLVAVIPLYVSRARRPRVIRFLGHGTGDELGPIHRPERRVETAEALYRTLAALDFDVALCEQLPGDVDWSDALGGREWRREASPVLTFTQGGWDSFLASRSANFRQQLARRKREIARDATATVRLADEVTLEDDLTTLFQLHRARFAGLTSDFWDTPFHREIARQALTLDRLRLWILELDGRPVAAWQGFHTGEITNYYQAGRDPSIERLSVGSVLLAHTIQAAAEEGAAEYRFGRGAEDFKYRFATADHGLESVVCTRRAGGRAALEVGLVYKAARRALRKRPSLERKERNTGMGDRLTP